ncbi:hypothetical protein C2I36_03655 [Rhodobacteraceae bacterium WD3A24]|nr:hypothetical protein C2I36_03655 [Rhodobacteraceae bacterium WD3A24]
MTRAGLMWRGLLFGVVAVLAGCSSEGELPDRVSEVAQIAGRLNLGGGETDSAGTGGTAAPVALPEGALEGVTDPVLLAVIPARDATATLGRIGVNGNVETWSTTDNTTLALRDGILVATRNLGHDLMSVDASRTRALISAGRGGAATRVHRRLGGDRATLVRRYRCVVRPGPAETLESLGQSRPTRRFEERCSGEGQEFVNIYWRERAGDFIWQSRQWAGPQTGEIVLQRLIE